MTAPTPVYRSAWTPDEDAELRRLHALTPVLSYTQIAAHIGRKRNACIGRAHRLDLPDRSEMKNHGRPAAKSGPKPGGTRRGPVSHARLFNAKIKREAVSSGPRLVRTVLADGSDGCLWPSGERPFVFCGCQVMKGLPYCEGHARLAYKPRTARRAG